ncbi:MAG TPA: CoA-binding protein [Phototrophicaceae bacterium]|nr:CoA-binding protein [Phototrophicaceae bacterium]
MIISDNDAAKRDLLQAARVIAVVGHSDNPERTSYQIAQYLRRAGYTVYPVNPLVQEIDGQKSYASLAEVPEPIDIVDVFRRSENLPEIVTEAIAVGAKAVWAQLGVADEAAAAQASAAGVAVVMDQCIKIEHARLLH